MSRDWDEADIVGSARKRLPKAINYLKHAIVAHESNNIFLRTGQISDQMHGKSKSAWIFNNLVYGQWEHEILSILRLWDSAGNHKSKHRLSIPTFIHYLCNDEIINTISGITYKNYFNKIAAPRNSSPEIESWIKNKNEIDAMIECKITKCRLRAIKRYCNNEKFKERLDKFVHIRINSIAHALYNSENIIPENLRIKDEDTTWLIARSIKILNWLTFSVMDSNFSIESFQQHMKDYSGLFWGSVRIEIKG